MKNKIHPYALNVYCWQHKPNAHSQSHFGSFVVSISLYVVCCVLVYASAFKWIYSNTQAHKIRCVPYSLFSRSFVFVRVRPKHYMSPFHYWPFKCAMVFMLAFFRCVLCRKLLWLLYIVVVDFSHFSHMANVCMTRKYWAYFFLLCRNYFHVNEGNSICDTTKQCSLAQDGKIPIHMHVHNVVCIVAKEHRTKSHGWIIKVDTNYHVGRS